MAQWGRNDKSVTVTTSTTKETSNGAPMGTYTLVKGGGGANAHLGNTSGTRAFTDLRMFGNTTQSAFIPGKAVGVFGVDPVEMEVLVADAANKPAHAGWVLRNVGSGGIVNASYTGTATGYNNTDVVTVSSIFGTNATIHFTTNATGGALKLTITEQGSGFVTVDNPGTITIANSTGGSTSGSGATFHAKAGGRAGRIQYETLVAMGSLGQTDGKYGTPATTPDASDDAILPDSV
jgi:hypothetical protein